MLAESIRRINPGPDGKPCLDDVRIENAIRQLEDTVGMRLMEANRHVTELLLNGTVTEGLPGWDGGRPYILLFIGVDDDPLDNNDFLVINQLMIASNFFEARVATVGAPPEAYLEWADHSPVPLAEVAEEVSQLPRKASHLDL